ncbi:MAG: bifunctional riboflavin kinase/FAD synthetase [Alphaproteobacteria bacterium]|nr:bifunctional riboflavin kinase/FAD synthetase [Alphaproteobacteria bacterium]
MRLIRDLTHFTPPSSGLSIALGNFDGMHLGHKAVIHQALAHAKTKRIPSAVVTFAPHPRRFFAPELPPLCLSTFREKWDAVASLGADMLIALRFNGELARLSPESFLNDILLKRLNTRAISVGHNFRFGHDRSGDTAFLAREAQKSNFVLQEAKEVTLGGSVCSSSRLRELLKAGEVSAAAKLLGCPFAISGRVIHGDKRGRSLGFPTANIPLSHRFTPANGVYAAHVQWQPNSPLPAVVNIGTRPSFDGRAPLLEAHLLAPVPSLYGKRLQVELLHFIRPEKRFSSVSELTVQIQADTDYAQDFLMKVSHAI